MAAMPQYPTIKPTPLKGKLKKEDIVRAVRAAKAARLKEEAEERRARGNKRGRVTRSTEQS